MKRASLIAALAATLVSGLVSGAAPRPPTNLCIEGTTACSKTVQRTGAIKWHPGHYMLTASVGQYNESEIAEIANDEHIVGIQQRFYWAQLEPIKGRYDFSAIERLLELCEKYDKRLVIQILDRGFNTSTFEGKLPQYLRDEYNGIWVGTATNGTRRVLARTWRPEVMDRFIALYRALGNRFDSEPYFEAITTEETVSGISTEIDSTYSATNIVTQFKRMQTSVRAAFPRTNVITYTNFIGGTGSDSGMQSLMAHMADLGIAAGDPDVIPGSLSLGDRVYTGVLGGKDYRGIIPMAPAVQGPELGGKEGSFTPAQLADHCISKMGCNYMFWVRSTWTPINWSDHIRPYLRGSPRPTVKTCPSSYPACSTD